MTLDPNMPPERIGQYRLAGKLGEGGMGMVYKATDEQRSRQVAVKLLRSEWASDQRLVDRFHREARITLALRHPNICEVYEFGELAGCPYIIMELLDGQTLSDMIDGWPLPLDRVLDIGMQVAEALEAAHDHGIIHRDIKPSNIFITEKGAKVLDFGLAKLGQKASIELASALAPNSSVSARGQTVGTATNMSPEQVAGEELDHRSDIFSLGIVLYEMATGVLPFRGIDATMIMKAILCEPHPLASKLNPNLTSELDAIIDRVLQKGPEARYQNMAELKADLGRVRHRVQGSEILTAFTPPRPADPPASSVTRRAEVAPLEESFAAVQVSLSETFAAVDRSSRDFLEQGSGILYCFRFPVGGIAYPVGFRSRLEPALESPRITQIRMILDSAHSATPQTFTTQVLPLVRSWAKRNRRTLTTAAEENRGRIYDPATERALLSWIFIDLSVELIPSFKIFVRDGEAGPQAAAGEAELLLTTQFCNVQAKDGSSQNLRLADTVLRVRAPTDAPLLATLGQIARRWDCLFP